MIKHLIVKNNKKVNSKVDYISFLNGYIVKYLSGDISRELYIKCIHIVDNMLNVDKTINENDKKIVNDYIFNIVKIKAV
jgi:hypothetical protein